MKFVVSIILIAILSYALCLFLPWWSIAIAAFVVALFVKQRPFPSFLSGFVALFLLWGAMSWIINQANDSILSDRVSLLVLKSESPLMLILLTAFVGAVVAGFAAISGSYLHKKI